MYTISFQGIFMEKTMSWWGNLITLIISGILSGILLIAVTSWIKNRKNRKKNEENFNIEIKVLVQELEGNFKGRGTAVPFQIYCLQNILKSSFFLKKHPQIFEQACQCLVIAGGKHGSKPSETQQAMRSLKESIETQIFNSNMST